MSERQPLATTLSKIAAGKEIIVTCLGGSITVGSSPRNAAKKPWRVHLVEYLRKRAAANGGGAQQVRCSIGALKSYGGVFLMDNTVLPHNPDLVTVEFCATDRTSPDVNLKRKAIEGIIRKLLAHPNKPDIVFLGAGCRPGTGNAPDGSIDHEPHREVCAYYGIPFIDMQAYMLGTLKSRGETWEDVGTSPDDHLHLNEYANEMWFDGMRNWIEEQEKIPGAANPPEDTPIKAPLVSDEFVRTRLVHLKPGTPGLTLEGGWEVGGQELGITYFMDSVMVGQPGARLVYEFEGTAVATITHAYGNGLKLAAVLDGEEMRGPYTNYKDEFGQVDVIASDMPCRAHRLELTVCEPLKRSNKELNPTARIAFVGVAGIPPGE